MIEVDGQKITWTEEMTIAELLQTMEDTDLCSVVRLNGRLVSSPEFSETFVPDGSIVQLLPLVAGG